MNNGPHTKNPKSEICYPKSESWLALTFTVIWAPRPTLAL